MIDTISSINKEVSKLLELPEDIVKKVNSFFWKEGIKASIQSNYETNIRIPKIGTLVTSRFKVNTEIRKIIGKLRWMRAQDREFKRKTKEEYIEILLVQLRGLLKRRNDIALIYVANDKRYKQNRNEKVNRIHKANMGE